LFLDQLEVLDCTVLVLTVLGFWTSTLFLEFRSFGPSLRWQITLVILFLSIGTQL
jgi:hypothetical protein